MNLASVLDLSCRALGILPMLGVNFREIPECLMHPPPPVDLCGTGDPPVSQGTYVIAAGLRLSRLVEAAFPLVTSSAAFSS